MRPKDNEKGDGRRRNATRASTAWRLLSPSARSISPLMSAQMADTSPRFSDMDTGFNTSPNISLSSSARAAELNALSPVAPTNSTAAPPSKTTHREIDGTPDLGLAGGLLLAVGLAGCSPTSLIGGPAGDLPGAVGGPPEGGAADDLGAAGGPVGGAANDLLGVSGGAANDLLGVRGGFVGVPPVGVPENDFLGTAGGPLGGAADDVGAAGGPEGGGAAPLGGAENDLPGAIGGGGIVFYKIGVNTSEKL